MDNQLNSLFKIDGDAGTARIDVRGNFTQASRPELMHEIQHVRRIGISSHNTVDLSHAAFVESSALAGLRPLSDYSSDELLAASDTVFGLLDDPAGHYGHELLARYDAIGEEIARRELAESEDPASSN